MAPGRIVVTPCAPRAARSALLATGHLSRASAREVSQRLGFEPTRRVWSFRVCGVDFAIWAVAGSEAYGVFATSGPGDFFTALVQGTRISYEPSVAS
jgi:hypothetical protein